MNANEPVISFAEPTEEKYKFSRADAVVAWVAVLLGYLFIRVLPVRENRLGAALFLTALWGVTYAWLRISGIRPASRANVFAVGAVAMIPALVITSDEFVIWWMYLGELAVLMYFISTAGGNSVENKLGGMFFLDVLGSIFVAPLGDIGAHPRALLPKRGRGAGKKAIVTLLWSGLGLCIAVVPTLIIVAMLSFDDNFMDIIDKIFSFDIEWSEQVWERIVAVIFGIPIAIYGYAAVIASRRKSLGDKMTAENCERLAERSKCLPSALVYAAITPILAVYVIFFVSQCDIYMSAFTGVLPEGFIYSDYARKGFFQLVCIAVINAAILLGVHLFVQRKAKLSKILLRIYMIVISAMTLILIATAMSRMALYIRTYGLTVSRIHASWFMVVLIVAFVLAIVKQIWSRLRLTPILLGSVAVLFALLIYSNVNAVVANYNTDAYLDGRLDSVDVDEIMEMKYAGVLAMIRLAENADDEKVREAAELYLQTYAVQLSSDNSPVSFNIPRARAKSVMRRHGYNITKPIDVDQDRTFYEVAETTER